MADTPALPERLLLRDVPEGLSAVPAPTGVGRTRRGHLRVRMADLVAQEGFDHAPAQVGDADLDWILATETRRWASIRSRFGGDAYHTACDLVRAGVVTLRCVVVDAVHLGDPLRWQLTPSWAQRRRDQLNQRSSVAAAWRTRADQVAASVEDLDPGLAAALRTSTPGQGRLPVLVFAAEDLIAGVLHDGPRAFSQAHFHDTKIREDVTDILLAAGASADTITALGLERSPYLGLGGPVTITGLDLSRLRGPIQLRADDPAFHDTTVGATARGLVILENLQAAERTCDTFPNVVTVYTAGQPARAALDTIARLADQVRTVLLVPDADLGGCRIAQRILEAIPQPGRVTLIDIGDHTRTAGRPFGPTSRTGLTALTIQTGPVSTLAQACLRRGHAVEQEQATRAAVAAALRHEPASPGWQDL
jgi:hypothetical protein